MGNRALLNVGGACRRKGEVGRHNRSGHEPAAVAAGLRAGPRSTRRLRNRDRHGRRSKPSRRQEAPSSARREAPLRNETPHFEAAASMSVEHREEQRGSRQQQLQSRHRSSGGKQKQQSRLLAQSTGSDRTWRAPRRDSSQGFRIADFQWNGGRRKLIKICTRGTQFSIDSKS